MTESTEQTVGDSTEAPETRPGAGSASGSEAGSASGSAAGSDRAAESSPESPGDATGEADTDAGSDEAAAEDVAEAADAEEADAEAADVDEADADDEVGETDADRIERLEAEGDIAADYLEELLDIADLDGDLDMDVDGDRASVSISGGDLSMLVGKGGQVLEALQELTRLAVFRETGERSRLMLDIGGFRAVRRTAVEDVARAAVERAQETGEAQHLEPMTPFERKVAHDVVAAAGLTSDSEGIEPRRHVVVRPHG